MAKGKAALDALEALLSGAKRVDIGDMTRPVTAARREALEAMLPKADDWGWKGGKPGEITGGEYAKYAPYFEENMHQRARKQAMKAAQKGKLADIDLGKTYANTYQRGLQDEQVAKAMKDFEALELADVPREWTGKLRTALRLQLQRPNDTIPPIMARQVSDLMRPMTNDQRETFVALLPEWDGSLDELADAARSL